jgi:hypothetical protein
LADPGWALLRPQIAAEQITKLTAWLSGAMPPLPGRTRATVAADLAEVCRELAAWADDRARLPGMDTTAAAAITTAAADATEQTPVTVWLQVGRTAGLVEIGTAYQPAGVTAILRHATSQLQAAQSAATHEAPGGTTEPADQSPAP